MRTASRFALLAVCAGLACSPSTPESQTARTERLSIATGGTGGVYYVYGGALARVISQHVPGVEATAEVTSASVDNLKFLRDGKADIAFTLADTLKDAAEGKNVFANRPIDLRALAVLYTNVTHVVALKSSKIVKLADLKGKVVSIGSAGSGTETIADRTLKAAGLDPATDVTSQNLSALASADALKDGKIDAFFWSGGISTAAVMDLATSNPIRMIDTSDVLPKLQAEFGEGLYRPFSVPTLAYPTIEAEVRTFGVSNVLVVPASFNDQHAYRIVKAMFDQHAALAAAHAEAKNLTLASAVLDSPVPFHPGALRYYKEKGVTPADRTPGK